MAKGNFIEYVVSDNENAYPDGGTQGGYWYERFDDALTNIDFGIVTLSANTTDLTFSHNLGAVPRYVYVKDLGNEQGSSYTRVAIYPEYEGVTTYRAWRGASSSTQKSNSNITLTDNSVTIQAYSSSYPFQGGKTMQWIVIA